jgi:soluble lytic murein transglycosylase
LVAGLLAGLAPGARAQGKPVAQRPAPGPWHVATAWADSIADRVSAASAVRAELAIGRVDRAARIMERHATGMDAATRAELTGAVAAGRSDWVGAAHAYAGAADSTGGHRSALLSVRAAAAFERAGEPDSAARLYRRARAGLPEIDGWLAVRVARNLTDEAAIEALLAQAPAAARPAAQAVRARARLLLGDAVAAESLLVDAGRAGHAAELALARGDSAAALRHALGALRGADTAEAQRGFVLVLGPLGPATAPDAFAAGRGAARLREWGAAARLAGRAVALGDSSVTALLAWGEWLEQAGRRRDALVPYTLAGAAGAFHAARARVRLGEREAGSAALLAFADAHPTDANAPAAAYLAADARASDSLFREVARRWPREAVASRARVRVALGRIEAGDSGAAIPYLEEEIERRGAEAQRARFLLARIALGRGDRDSARAALATVAADDSLGYYGFRARTLADLPMPVLAPPPPRAPSGSATALLRALASLDDAGLAEEAAALREHLLTRAWENPGELLDVAEGLAATGRAPDAIRLGFAAMRRLSLNDPRVLRVVFPWPDRALIEAEAEAFGLDPYLLAAVIRQESWFSAGARSRAGAVGYMQLMPATARGVAARLRAPWSDAMLRVPDANVHLGSAHLAGLLARYAGDDTAAIASYNAGGRPVDRWRRGIPRGDHDALVERISYPETVDYVRSVLRNHALYRLLYPPAVE